MRSNRSRLWRMLAIETGHGRHETFPTVFPADGGSAEGTYGEFGNFRLPTGSDTPLPKCEPVAGQLCSYTESISRGWKPIASAETQ
jgi:hypothetical protein